MSEGAKPQAAFCSCLTPPGRGALATLGASGPLAWAVVRELFRTRGGQTLPEAPEAGRRWLGRIGDDMADECVLAVRSAAPVRVEMHVHGGGAVTDWLLALLVGRGLRRVSWEDWLRLEEADPLRAEAAVMLACAPTERTAAILLDQYHGALRLALGEIESALSRGECEQATTLLAELAGRARLGRRLTTPWRVVVAGAPNVGKSSLVNAIAGHQRCIVAPTPGTTRDAVSVTLALDGWPVELIDTAGQRETGEALEEAGIARAREEARTADLVLWVVDATSEPVEGVGRLVVNKMDQGPSWDLGRALGGAKVSARTGEGVAALVQAVARWLVPEAPPSGAAIPFGERIGAEVERARNGAIEDAGRIVRGLLEGVG